MELLGKAAAQGHAYAMKILGSIHDLRKEHEQAVAWYTKGAEAGLPLAMFNLAVSLDAGEGVAAPDYPAAADWYRRAADADPAGAANNLAGSTISAAAGLGRWCLPRHLLHLRPSFLELNSITRRGEHYLPGSRARRHA